MSSGTCYNSNSTDDISMTERHEERIHEGKNLPHMWKK